MMLVGGVIALRALQVNAFFETTVRIQSDRGHQVCTAGPYRFVRHPGYVGAMLVVFGAPLVLGSRWAFVPVIVEATALVVRTAYEDRMLQSELPGYDEYTQQTRYRLIPFVW